MSFQTWAFTRDRSIPLAFFRAFHVQTRGDASFPTNAGAVKLWRDLAALLHV